MTDELATKRLAIAKAYDAAKQDTALDYAMEEVLWAFDALGLTSAIETLDRYTAYFSREPDTVKTLVALKKEVQS